MIYSEFGTLNPSLLGLGAMRLPLATEDPNGPVDEKQVEEMIDFAIANGVNYFDTAYPYHGGQSERILGRVLSRYPREKYYLATKYPGHQIASTYDPVAVFEEQLRNCQTDYFDFYLLHNVYEKSLEVYNDPRWGIMDYFLEQKRQGRIRYLGFSTHFLAENLEKYLDEYGDMMDFCQIQLNFVDWSLQNGKAKYEMLEKHGLPIVVMEPLRGGKLATASGETAERLAALCPGENAAAWAFRWLQDLTQVMVVLSGMSNLEQMKENVATFAERRPMTEEQRQLLFALGEEHKHSVPCTACRYCCDGCPAGLDIPKLLEGYNESKFLASVNLSMTIEAMPEDKRPAACVACGKCTRVCPQNIDIPAALRDFVEILGRLPSWEQICREREEANRRSKAQEAEGIR